MNKTRHGCAKTRARLGLVLFLRLLITKEPSVRSSYQCWPPKRRPADAAAARSRPSSSRAGATRKASRNPATPAPARTRARRDRRGCASLVAHVYSAGVAGDHAVVTVISDHHSRVRTRCRSDGNCGRVTVKSCGNGTAPTWPTYTRRDGIVTAKGVVGFLSAGEVGRFARVSPRWSCGRPRRRVGFLWDEDFGARSFVGAGRAEFWWRVGILWLMK